MRRFLSNMEAMRQAVRFTCVRFASRTLAWRVFCTQRDGHSATETPSFDDEVVKSLLKKMTSRNLDKIFAARKGALSPPTYKLMTEEDMLQAQKEAEERADEMLEMPAVLDERNQINEVLEENDTIRGFDESSFVFTDVSASVTDRTRRIIVREPHGKLRSASWEERDRMNLLYFPREGREFELPAMLKDKHLQVVFDQNRHEDVLDLVCVQCEGDSADYIRVHQHTYEDIVEKQAYDLLRSTRHFGGLAYYLTKTRNIKGLLDDMVEQQLCLEFPEMLVIGRLEDTVALVKLHHLLHPKHNLSIQAKQDGLEGLPLVLAFVEKEGSIESQHRLKTLQASVQHDVHCSPTSL